VAITAIAFDIGGVLEKIGPVSEWLGGWPGRLGLTQAQFDAALGRATPGSLQTGGVSEAAYHQACVAELGLSPEQEQRFFAHMWDWYCGRLDTELAGFVAALRPRYRTGILSNSGPGARREETARYGFAELVDVLLYSHEIRLAKPDPAAYARLCAELGAAPAEVIFVDDLPANVAAAREAGLVGLLHTDTPETIAAIEALTRA
jgi:HAD superfamily hydrolase (TIGR01509 family)